MLVAEDDSPSRQGTVDLLVGAGFRVDVARDGAEALEFLAGLGGDGAMPDVLVTDLDMPRVTGAELIALLRNDPHYAALRILILSSFDGSVTPPSNVQRLMSKPVRGDDLLRAVSQLCARGPSAS